MSIHWRQHYRKPGKPKKSFDTQESAEAFARRQKIEAYQCSVCSKWHVGGNDHGKLEEV
jgi:hypothetical protein